MKIQIISALLPVMDSVMDILVVLLSCILKESLQVSSRTFRKQLPSQSETGQTQGSVLRGHGLTKGKVSQKDEAVGKGESQDILLFDSASL